MKKHKIWFVVGILFIIISIIFGIIITQKSTSEEKVIKIGAILPLTGTSAFLGEDIKRGIELAEEDIKKELKLNIKVIIVDNQSEPKVAVSLMNKLLLEKVKYVITTMSSVSLALIPIAKSKEVLLFANAAHPSITGSGEMIFRHSNTAPQEVQSIVNFINNNFSPKKIFILWINDEFGRSMLNELKSKINTDFQEESFEKNQTNFRSIVEKILRYSPEIVIITGYGKPLGLAIKTLRELNFNGKIFTNSGLVLTKDAQIAAGVAIKGVYFNNFYFQTDDPKYLSFIEKYKSRYGDSPSPFSILEYNTMTLLGFAIKNVGDDPKAVANFIKSLNNYIGVGEKMEIKNSGDILPEIKIEEF